MGAYKNKMLEEMEDEDHTDEYGASMDNDEDDDSLDEDGEERAIERSIEDELQTLNELEADMSTEQKAAYAHLSEGVMMAKERISIIKSILSDYKYDDDDRAKNDDAAFCAKENYDSDMRRQYDNDELVEVIVDLQKKVEKDNG